MQPDTMNLAYESAFVISPERFYSEYELTDENYEQESFSRKKTFSFDVTPFNGILIRYLPSFKKN